MITFKTYLTEAVELADVDFNDYRIGTPDLYVYDFSVNGRDYSITFERQENQVWERMMSYHKLDGTSSYAKQDFNDGSQFKVMSYQFGYLIAFLKALQPDEVNFTADSSEGARAAVYNRILTRLIPTLKNIGYSYSMVNQSINVKFLVTKL